MMHDNDHFLLTTPAFTVFRAAGYVHVQTRTYKDIKNNTLRERKQTIVDGPGCESYLRELTFRLIPIEYYPPEVSQMYSDVKKISGRSMFTSSKYFEVMNSYGQNRDYKIDAYTHRDMIVVLNEQLRAWATNPLFEFDLEEEFKSGRWLTHIKTGSNSGFPANIKQSKELMIPAATASLKIFRAWKKGEKIDWHKLAFEMGYRTERAEKHRVVCMAAQYEKPLSAVISVFLDLTAQYLPFNLPRKFGSFSNVASKIFESKGEYIFSKDYEAFDTNIPLHVFIILRDWFKTIGNTLCDIIAFELDLIIHAYIIITPTTAFWLAALPSGIGITQFIGSLIHWLFDVIVELTGSIAFYQADDNILVTDLTLKELQAKCDEIMKRTKMKISEVGKKSFISAGYNKFLQKVLDRNKMIYYNHEVRGLTNAFFREREITDDTLFEQLFQLRGDDAENKSKKAVLAYLGNLVSFGQYAPSLTRIFAYLYGRNRTGFTTTQILWGLNNIETYLSEYLAAEQHRPMEQAGWCKGLFQECIAKYKWSNITSAQVLSAAESINMKTYASV